MDTALQSSVYVSSPEFAGWLTKRGFHWRKLWKKRWVALHGAEIVYMDKEPTLENSSTMTITKAQITTATVIDREDLDGNPNGFAIHINDGHTPTWYLRADSAREKKSWLMRLQHVHAIVKWLEDFEKVKVLGVGGTGIVYELLHKSNGTRFAMKEMEIKNKAQMQMAISEAEMLKDIMENVSHPNIMHIEKVFQVGSKFYLVFPLCTGGELYEHIIRKGHFTEHDAAVIMRDLLSGLDALHKHDILHLDIKPENILFDSMGDDARIKITDFGLSKIFTDTAASQQKSKFSMKLMEERLKAFSETGELNRERLRGTIGYMSPELILTGHCSRATDVFAAGVVLYILLCGRPPFNSKSNREVLEKTARGLYSMNGAEWDDISPEAKDLVAKMLIVNPEERISTEDILAHPWLKQLDEDFDEVSSTSSASVDISATSSNKTLSLTSRLSRKGTGHNLASALRHLSGHVKQLRSEKLASNVSRLVSLMQQSGAKSTLSKLYLIPGGPNTDQSIAESANISEEDLESITLNSDLRDAVSSALGKLADADGGKLSVEQFLSVLKHFNSLASQGNNVALGPLIIAKFLDRDNDGYITADDIFAAQALILQRSESFLRVAFRIYTEALWYPGRQLNLMSMLQQTPSKGANSAQDPSATPTGMKVLGNDQACLMSVVEPPKFITQRHVAAVFEKMGYETSAAQKVFSILMEASSRFKTEETMSSKYRDDIGPDRILEDEEYRGGTFSDYSAPVTPVTPNAALARAFGDFDDDEDEAPKSGAAPEDTRKSASATADSTVSMKVADPGASARMDFQDFVKATELDDVLVQVILRKSRYRLINIMQRAELRMRAMSLDEAELDNSVEASSKRKSRTYSTEVTASVLEEEMKAAIGAMKLSDAPKSSFPIANAVGRATISAALGLAAKMTSGAQALMEATKENMEAGDESSTNSSVKTPTPSGYGGRASFLQAGADSDDDV